MRVKLFTSAGPGRESKLISEHEISPNNNNGYPEVIIKGAQVFIETPVAGEYREVFANVITSTAKGTR